MTVKTKIEVISPKGHPFPVYDETRGISLSPDGEVWEGGDTSTAEQIRDRVAKLAGLKSFGPESTVATTVYVDAKPSIVVRPITEWLAQA
jgi:hypothetical protein